MASGRPERKILRASDAEREQVVDRLKHHAGEGRLTVEELSDRVGQALSAKTLGELDALVADLPRVELLEPVPSSRSARVPALTSTVTRLVALNLIVLALVVAEPGRHGFGVLFWVLAFSVLRLVRRANRLARRAACSTGAARRRFPPPAPPWTLR